MTKTEIHRPGDSSTIGLNNSKTSLIASSQKLNGPHWSHQFVARCGRLF